MKDALFDELRASMQEALAHARGKRELRTTVLPAAPAPMGAAEVRALRERVNASQAVFARYLNVSTRLVQAWEADRRHPEGAALRLLELGARDPATVFAGLLSTTRRRAARRPREDAPRVALSEAGLD
jgi:putative transcriptional regulator